MELQVFGVLDFERGVASSPDWRLALLRRFFALLYQVGLLLARVDNDWLLLLRGCVRLENFLFVKPATADSVYAPDLRLAFRISIIFVDLLLAQEELLLGAAFVIIASSQNLGVMLLDFLVFLQNVDVAHEQLGAPHFEDVALLDHILLFVFVAVRHRLHEHVHALAHLVRHQRLHALLIVESFEVPRLDQFALLFVLRVFELVEDRGLQHKLITHVRELDQQLPLRFEFLLDVGAFVRHLAVQVFAHEVARPRRNQRLARALPFLKVEEAVRVVRMRDRHDAERVPTHVLAVVDACFMLARNGAARTF